MPGKNADGRTENGRMLYLSILYSWPTLDVLIVNFNIFYKIF